MSRLLNPSNKKIQHQPGKKDASETVAETLERRGVTKGLLVDLLQQPDQVPPGNSQLESGPAAIPAVP